MMLPCKQTTSRWYLVYVDCLQTVTLQEETNHVQDCIHRLRTLRHPVQPLCRHPRPPVDGVRGDDDPQWRRAPRRHLGPAFHLARPTFDGLAPIFGAIFVSLLSTAKGTRLRWIRSRTTCSSHGAAGANIPAWCPGRSRNKRRFARIERSAPWSRRFLFETLQFSTRRD